MNPPCTCTPDPPAEYAKGVCVKCWTWKHNPDLRRAWEGRAKVTKIKLRVKLDAGGKATAEADCGKSKPRHLRRCDSLAERIESRAGCNGWMCKHTCSSTREDVADFLGGIPEAVPGDDCQECPGFVDAGPFLKKSQ